MADLGRLLVDVVGRLKCASSFHDWELWYGTDQMTGVYLDAHWKCTRCGAEHVGITPPLA